MSDDYRQRMLAITEELRAQNVGPYTSAPPAYRLAWLLGLHVRPPLYQTFASLALETGVSFGVLFGLTMWFLVDRGEGSTIIGALIGSAIAGIGFGLIMAGFYRRKSARLRLPPLGKQS
jgi:hypothetical protein